MEPFRRIFISHSSKDLHFVHRLAHDLQQVLGNEQAVWYDAYNLNGGDEWWPKIVEEMQRCTTFLVVLSPNAINSKWVDDEITIAWVLKNSPARVHLIPLLYQPL